MTQLDDLSAYLSLLLTMENTSYIVTSYNLKTMWNISVTGPKSQLEYLLDEELKKYDAVDRYNGQLDHVKAAALAMTEDVHDADIVVVKSIGGDSPTFGAKFTHMLSVSVLS